MFLKSFLKVKNIKKAFIKLKPIELMLLKLKSFKTLQKHFCKLFFLIYFNLKRKLYTDLNASKQYKFKIIIYYIKNKPENNILKNIIKLIIFFNKKLNNTEKNY